MFSLFLALFFSNLSLVAVNALQTNTVSFDQSSGTAAERTSPYTATVVLTTSGGATSGAIVVNVNAADISTSGASDYTFTNPTQVTFPAGSQNGDTQTVDVVMVDDQLPESDEQFTLTLSISSGSASLGTPATQTVTIRNNATLESSLYWSDGQSIQQGSLDASGATTLIGDILPRYIAVDDTAGKIYWADLDAEAISRADLDGSNIETEFIPGLDTPMGVALDTVGGKIYWTDGTGINRANLSDGSSPEYIVFGDSGPTGDIGFDPLTNTIYWTEEEAVFFAEVSDPEGTMDAIVFEGAGGIHVDYANDHLYWVGAFDSQIHRTQLSTGSDTVIWADYEVSLAAPRDIFADTDNNKLFWTDISNESLERSELDGSGTPTKLIEFISQPFSVVSGGSEIVQQEITIEFAEATLQGSETVTSPTGFIDLSTSDGAVTGQSISVDVTVNPPGTTANAGTDYTLTTTYSLPAGTAPGTYDLTTFNAVDDSDVEADKVVELQLGNPSGVTIGTQDTLAYTILNDDNYEVVFATTSGNSPEDVGTYTADVTLNTGGGSSVSAVVVDIAISNNTTSDTDYTLVTTQVTFPAGSANGASQTISVTINDDTIPEGDESFALSLSINSGPAELGTPNVHTGTIESNDVQVQFASSANVAPERNEIYSARVILRTGGATITSPVVVSFDATDISATSADYSLSTTQVTFPTGSGDLAEQFVNVTITDDQTPESSEVFQLDLTLDSGPATTGSITVQDVTILNNALLQSRLFTAGNVDTTPRVIESDLNGSNPTEYTITSGGIADIAVDDITNTVFRSSGSSLYRHELLTDTETQITVSGISNFYGVFDLDPFAERLYLYGKVNSGDANNSIIVTDFDGNFVSSDTITGAMIDMAVDPFGGYVYWTAGQTLYRLPLAGGTQESFVIGADSITGAFDIDAVNSRLYFFGKVNSADASNSIIETELNGAYSQSFTATGGVSDMAVDPVDGYVYRLSGSTLYRHQINNGAESIISVATSPAASPFQVDISYLDAYVNLQFLAATTSGVESVANPSILSLATTNDNPTTEQITVDIAVTGGTATGDDYTLSPATLTLPVGTNPGTLALTNLSIVNDDIYEIPDETLDLSMSNVVGAIQGDQTTTTYTIEDDDPNIIVEFASDTLNDDESTTTPTIVTVTTSDEQPTLVDFSATLAVTGGTLDSDYTLTNPVVVPAGTTSGDTIALNNFAIIDDADVESDEVLSLTLSAPVAGTLGTQTTTSYTINDNDTAAADLSVDTTPISEEGGVATLTVTLDKPNNTGATISVPLVVDEASTAEETDYTLSATTVEILDGETTGTVTVTGVTDTLFEVDETVIINLGTLPAKLTAGTTTTQTVTLTDDETATVTLTADVTTIDEEGGVATLTVTLSTENITDDVLSIPLVVDGASTAAETDYTLSATTVEIADGVTTGTVTVTGATDTLFEGEETVILNFGTLPARITAGTPEQQTITITDDEGANATLTVDTNTIAEDGGTATLTVTIDTSNETGGDLIVPLVVNESSTAEAADYTLGDVTILAGETSGTATLTGVTDSLFEGDETVIVEFGTLPTGFNAGTPATQTIALTDSETATASMAVDTTNIAEDGGIAIITVTISATNESGADMIVPIIAGVASTASGTDYSFSTTDVVIADGATTGTATLTGATDSIAELDETVVVEFGTPLTPLTAGTPDTVTVTLTDNDAATVAINDVTRAENADGGATTIFTFTVTLTGEVDTFVTAEYATSDGTATAGNDYQSTGDAISLDGSPGGTDTIEVIVLNDSLPEVTETFTVTLSNLQASGRNVTFSDATGLGTITNDDITTADVNIDGYITPADLAYVLNRLGTTDITADIDADGTVTETDAELVRSQLGTTLP